MSVYASNSNRIREEWSTGQKLERYLYDHQVSKYRLATMAGVDMATVYRLCNGDQIGNLDTWQKIAQALGCKVSDITGR